MAPKTSSSKTEKKVEKKEVVEEQTQENQSTQQYSINDLREWFSYVVELDLSKLNKETETKEEYNSHFTNLNKIFIDATNLLRCLINKRNEIVEQILKLQNEYKAKFDQSDYNVEGPEHSLENETAPQETLDTSKQVVDDDDDEDDVPVVPVKKPVSKKQSVKKTEEEEEVVEVPKKKAKKELEHPPVVEEEEEVVVKKPAKKTTAPPAVVVQEVVPETKPTKKVPKKK